MSKYAHKIKTQRKLITIQEWADFLGISRTVVYTYIQEYQNKGKEYDPKDIYSILKFYQNLIFKQYINDILKTIS